MSFKINGDVDFTPSSGIYKYLMSTFEPTSFNINKKDICKAIVERQNQWIEI